MNSTSCIAALVLFLASTAPSHVPPDALPEIEAQAQPAPAPRWSAQALAAWKGPWVPRPNLYDHRYVTW